ncbi:ferredoxin [Amycolatopsis xylanica]|uniref:Ferredoxin n=1 Tax=Amycolatopsis xylanica TaxID=589385 RepID=A0A1H3HA05_9PSEU|nr:ferredoxin [Amycolatopsis xylanica]SDY12326.1 ferredoxin [Amycolatopsis xylanica]
MKVHADRDRCVGSALCVLTEPAVFDQDDGGLVVVLSDEESGRVRDAIDLCPSQALRLAAE